MTAPISKTAVLMVAGQILVANNPNLVDPSSEMNWNRRFRDSELKEASRLAWELALHVETQAPPSHS